MSPVSISKAAFESPGVFVFASGSTIVEKEPFDFVRLADPQCAYCGTKSGRDSRGRCNSCGAP